MAFVAKVVDADVGFRQDFAFVSDVAFCFGFCFWAVLAGFCSDSGVCFDSGVDFGSVLGSCAGLSGVRFDSSVSLGAGFGTVPVGWRFSSLAGFGLGLGVGFSAVLRRVGFRSVVDFDGRDSSLRLPIVAGAAAASTSSLFSSPEPSWSLYSSLDLSVSSPLSAGGVGGFLRDALLFALGAIAVPCLNSRRGHFFAIRLKRRKPGDVVSSGEMGRRATCRGGRRRGHFFASLGDLAALRDCPTS